MKKQLCFMLCLLMVICAVNVTFVQASGTPENLSASYVKFSASAGGSALTSFPAAGTSVFASADITNSGTAPQSAVLWIGVYYEQALVDVEYSRIEVPEGTTLTFTTPGIAIKEGYNNDNTDIKAYVWDSFTGANAVVRSAHMLKGDGDLEGIYIDGVAISGFTSDVTDYTCYVSPGAVITAKTKDNATAVSVPDDFALPGSIQVKAIKSDGTVKTYNLKLKINGKITYFKKNPIEDQTGCKPQAMNWGDPLVPTVSYAYTDRSSGSSFYPLTYVSADIVGDTLIRMPLNDVRLYATEPEALAFMNGNNTYFSFTADTGGRIVVLSNSTISNYDNVSNGWTKINNGSTFFPVDYDGKHYTDYNKIDGNTTTDVLPKTYNPTANTCIAREQSGAVTWYRFAYAKYFSAGETVMVPTPNKAALGSGSNPSYGEGAVWVVTWGLTNPNLDVEPAPAETTPVESTSAETAPVEAVQ